MEVHAREVTCRGQLISRAGTSETSSFQGSAETHSGLYPEAQPEVSIPWLQVYARANVESHMRTFGYRSSALCLCCTGSALCASHVDQCACSQFNKTTHACCWEGMRKGSPAHSIVRGGMVNMPEEMGTPFLQVNRPSMQP